MKSQTIVLLGLFLASCSKKNQETSKSIFINQTRPNNDIITKCADLSINSELFGDFEVKFLLDSKKVLDKNYLLIDKIRNLFQMNTDFDQIKVVFLDTDDQVLDAEGWNNRLRLKKNNKNFELTYKKRYKIENGDLKTTLELAQKEGFEFNAASSYEAQVEYGCNKLTLSLSNNKKSAVINDSLFALPEINTIQKIMIDKIPGKLNNWKESGWGKSKLKASRIYGEINYKKWVGIFKENKIAIELWPIIDAENLGIENIVEISFKANTFEEAKNLRNLLESILIKENILLPRDGLKTQLVLQRY